MSRLTLKLRLAVGLVSLLGAVVAVHAAVDPPAWAYPATPPEFQPAPDDGSKRRVPGSTREYTYGQIEDSFNPADWYPAEHPAMPDPVGRGRRPSVRACGWCHLPNGLGHPQSASLAGLPVDYIAAQLGDFRSGNRKNSVGNTIMAAISQAMTTAEVRAAAGYYSGLKLKPWIKVVEARSVPRTRIIEGNLRLPAAPSATEALGQRIVEVPEDPARTRLYDSHAGFVAYVPPGSLKRGEYLVTTGGATMVQGQKVAGKTMECTQCHGRDLHGMPAGPGAPSPTPPLAGRSPTYIVRQLYDMQQGARRGANAELMKPVVARLTHADMINIAAYLASRAP